ncbi:hypothetical protein B9Z55_017799 [Caenorhabditis nigoni]|nr:hypothetical protein B9Z55_017799 [Caenorhabditis nigoni]
MRLMSKEPTLFGVRWSNGGQNIIREGRGIIASNGEFWQEHRRFALKTLRDFGLGRNIMEEKIMEEYNYRSLERVSIFDAFTPVALFKSDLWKWRKKKLFEPFYFIYGMVQKGIQKRVDAIASGKHVISEEGDDFVDAFLIKMEKDKKDGVRDSTFTLDTLAIDLFDLWIAGQETTSTTLTWACVCLLNHPEVVKELRMELVDVTGGTRPVSLTDKPNTPYLTATVNEIQRTASILNINPFRQLQEDTVIDGQPVSAGAVVTTQMSLLHTNEAVFKNHTVFDPSRFMENNNLEKTLMPFGIGKRSCLGESLARAELYLITGNLVLDFNFEPVGLKPEIKTASPFGSMKRPPNYHIRFVPVNN